MLLWCIANGALPTKDILVRFNSEMNTTCALCDCEDDTAKHLFWRCPFARALWFGAGGGVKSSLFQFNQVVDLVEFIVSPP